MIIFDGYISGNAEKLLRKKNKNLGRNIFLFALLIIFPIVLSFCIETKEWLVVILYSSLFIIVPLLAEIPQSKKERKMITPYKITIDEETLICKATKFEEIRSIQDVKIINDHGDFFEIIFPFGKVSNNFICQKNLLSKGSLENFESLFKDKIQKTGD